jgi:hypothetical protein
MTGLEIVTDATGNGSFSVNIGPAGAPGQFITATATSRVPGEFSSKPQNTSEFSVGVAIAHNPLASLTIALYENVLHRPPSLDDINFWSALLNNGLSRVVLAQSVWQSPEHRRSQVDQYYQQYFGHLDSAGTAFWVSQMQAGLSETDVQIRFLNSPEYGASHATFDSYLVGLYAEIYGRAPDAAGVNYFRTLASLGVPRDQIARIFLTSTEAYTILLPRYYAEFLHRAPDTTGGMFWLNALMSGRATPQSVAETILASDEYFMLATAS